jgi:pimeloyl-ACP methyl ester carboxylesterase
VELLDGRILNVLTDAGDSRRPLVFHWGTPSAAVWFEPLARAANESGLSLVTYARPGYDGATPQPGRQVADVAADVAAILDALGHDEFLSLGWSGGGPHSLACAALLPGRCLAAGSFGGVAPYPADGLDWMAGMGKGNVEEFSAAIRGEDALRPLLQRLAKGLDVIQGTEMAAALGSLASDVDKAALTGEFAEALASSFRGSVSSGIEGWVDDDLALTHDWGFALTGMRAPVAVWHGQEDRFVPFAHGEWLTRQIPGVQSHLLKGHGHLSLFVDRLDQAVQELPSLGKRSVARRVDAHFG